MMNAQKKARPKVALSHALHVQNFGQVICQHRPWKHCLDLALRSSPLRSSTLTPKTAEHPSFSNSTLCTGLLTTTLPPSLPSLKQESIVLHLFAFEFLLQPDDMEKLGSGLYELRTKLGLRGPTWRSMVLITYLVTVVITQLPNYIWGNCSYGTYNWVITIVTE